MSTFFTFLSVHRDGIFILIACLAVAILFTQWFAWIFYLGRFHASVSRREGGLRFVFGDLMVKIIDDFRHFLALLLVLIFAIALAYTMANAWGKIDEITAALQAVVSTLGGLIGAIIGYYFGESVAKRPIAPPPVTTISGEPEQRVADPDDSDTTITPASARPAEPTAQSPASPSPPREL